MKKLFNPQTAIGVILLSLIAIGMWEFALRDTLSFLEKFILSLSTLGLEEYKDAIYVQIARGFYEAASLKTLALLVGGIFGFFFGMISVMTLHLFADKDKFPKFLFAKKKAAVIFLAVYTVTFFGILVLDLTRLSYVDGSISYYHQLVSIATPDTSVSEIQDIDAQFAQISSKNDYVSVIERLKLTINNAHQKLPAPPSFIF
jgi:hypothetical protein